MNSFCSAFPVLVAFLGLSTIATAADLSGGWKGTWTKDGDALPVTVTFDKTGKDYAGSFSSDALQAADIPFKEVSEKGGKVHIVLKGDETTTIFDGMLSGAALNGTFVDVNTKGTFALTRTALPAAAIKSRDVPASRGNVPAWLRPGVALGEPLAGGEIRGSRDRCVDQRQARCRPVDRRLEQGRLR
jgi:hypothetical protein